MLLIAALPHGTAKAAYVGLAGSGSRYLAARRGDELEMGVGACHREQLLDRPPPGHQAERAPVLPAVGEQPEQQPQARRIKEIELSQIDHELTQPPSRCESVELVLELIHRCQVKLTEK